MTAREIQIAKKILNSLHDQDGHQLHALSLHGDIGGLTFCTGAEFDHVLAALDARRLVIGVRTQFKGTLWSISDAGEAARLEM